jgi:hypothetical protein
MEYAYWGPAYTFKKKPIRMSRLVIEKEMF